MNKKFRRLGAFAIAAAMQVRSGRARVRAGRPAAVRRRRRAAARLCRRRRGQTVEATPSTETTPGTELPVLYVTSVEVMRTSTEPKLDIVRVTGLTGSQGWSAPQLVPTFAGKPLDGILDLQFIATMPQQIAKGRRLCADRRGLSAGSRATCSKACACAPRRMRSRSSRCRASTRRRSTSTTARTASARNLSNAARRSPASKASSARRISPRYCGGSSRRAASGASRTIRTGST